MKATQCLRRSSNVENFNIAQTEAPPCLRVGVRADQGRRSKMEDAFLAVDDMSEILNNAAGTAEVPEVAAFYAVRCVVSIDYEPSHGSFSLSAPASLVHFCLGGSCSAYASLSGLILSDQ